MATDDEEEPPICGTCLGAQGEWINQNGNGPAQSVWVPCGTCSGSGRA
ncbi:hypothetical protein AB0395_44885 [Streptosporangium sp. NPDC051023]